MSLQLEEHTIAGGGGVTVQVHGEVDSSNASELRERLRVAATLGTVLIDLRAVPFMDSAGLGAVIFGIRQARTTGGRVALCVGAGSAVERLLSLTGFDRVVPVVSSLDAAYEAIRIDKPDLAAGGDA